MQVDGEILFYYISIWKTAAGLTVGFQPIVQNRRVKTAETEKGRRGVKDGGLYVKLSSAALSNSEVPA